MTPRHERRRRARRVYCLLLLGVEVRAQKRTTDDQISGVSILDVVVSRARKPRFLPRVSSPRASSTFRRFVRIHHSRHVFSRYARYYARHAAPTIVPLAAFLGAIFPSAFRFLFSLASRFARTLSFRLLSFAACSLSLVALFPMSPGASLSPNAAATCPK